MSVFDVAFLPKARQRIIVNTDAKNETDDQCVIVHAMLTLTQEITIEINYR